MSRLDHDQIGHIAQLAVLAMCARGVAGAEFDSSAEVLSVRFTVLRVDDGSLPPVDIEFMGSHSIPLGGMSL